MAKNPNKIVAKRVVSDYVLDTIFTVTIILVFITTLYPFLNSLAISLNDADDTKYIVFVLCAVILVMNIMIISIITLLNMYHSAKEISLMRLIGISMKKINLLYIIQNSIMGLIAVILAFAVSRGCMVLMNDYVESMGVVLNMGKVYPVEFLILLAVFVISVVPTVIWTFSMSKKDSITD